MKNRVISVFLAVVLTLVTGSPFVVTNEPVIAEPMEYVPKDSVEIKLVADGTHDGVGTETFIQTKNGFTVGDDTINDGVVSSGDICKYEYKLNIAAGPARKVKVYFSSTNGWLDMKDAKTLSFTSSNVKSKWIESEDAWEFDIPRGLVGSLTGSVVIKAKDTKGKVERGNKIKVRLVNGSYTYDSLSSEVTVVSAPFADLALNMRDVGYDAYQTVYNQETSEGKFYITPIALILDGYSKNGLTTGGDWHTDLDVSKFPSGTKFWVDGAEKSVVSGLIKNLKGQGTSIVKYKLPDSAFPSSTNTELKTYMAKLVPYADSFAIGGTNSVSDFGAGEDEYFDTSTPRVLDGASIKSRKGVNLPNNNYINQIWQYEPAYDGDLWWYGLYAPRDIDSLIYEDGNKKFKTSDYYKEGRLFEYYNAPYDYVTTDNEMYAVSALINSRTSTRNLKGVILGNTINLSSGGVKVFIKYDTSRQPVVYTESGVVISPSLYTVEYRKVPTGEKSPLAGVEGASAWSTVVTEDMNQCRVKFKDVTLAPKDEVRVCVPLKTLSNYSGGYDLVSESTGVLVTRGDYYSKYEGLAKIRVPKMPTIQAGLAAVETLPISLTQGTQYFTAEFRLKDLVVDPIFNSGYTARSVLTFDKYYDASSFRLVSSNFSGLSVSAPVMEGDGSFKITIERRNSKLYDNYNGTHALRDVRFKIDSKVGIVSLEHGTNNIKACVSEVFTLEHPLFSGTVLTSAPLEASYIFKTSKEVVSVIRSKYAECEVSDDLVYYASASASTAFSQEIYLPYNGDISLWSGINSANGSVVSIDNSTGLDSSGAYEGIGRSKIAKSYRIKGIKFKEFVNETEVYFRGTRLPVSADGVVDVSSLGATWLKGSKEKLVVKVKKAPSDYQPYNFLVEIVLDTGEAGSGSDYVMWLGRTKNLAGDSVINSKNAWPSVCSLYSSNLSGNVFEDFNVNYKFDGDEIGYTGVTVNLKKKDGSLFFVDGERVTSKDVATVAGRYSFKNLHSGEYVVSLKNVKRKANSDEVESVGGSTSVDAHEGDLKLFSKNRFGETNKLKQTVSYPNNRRKNSSNIVNIVLNPKGSVSSVDFGFDASFFTANSWTYNIYAPRDLDKTIFEIENKQFGSSYVGQGQMPSVLEEPYDAVTTDSEFYAVSSLNNYKDANYDLNGVILGNAINLKVDDTYVSAKYDSVRKPVVMLGDTVLEPSQYELKYRKVDTGEKSPLSGVHNASAWSSVPSDESNQCVVVFGDCVLQGKKTLKVYIPMRTLSNYSHTSKYDLLFNSAGILSAAPRQFDSIVSDLKVKKSKSTTVSANLEAVIKVPIDLEQGTLYYKTRYTSKDEVVNPIALRGYSVKKTLMFEKYYDADSFKLVNGGAGINVSSPNVNADGSFYVELTQDNVKLERKGKKYYVMPIEFTINSKNSIISNDSGNPNVKASVFESIEVNHAKFGSGAISSGPVEAYYLFKTNNRTETSIKARANVGEVSDLVLFDISVKSPSTFTQEIVLPYNGDKSMWSGINSSNGISVNIDNGSGFDTSGTYSGIGRTKVDKAYKIGYLKFKDYKAGIDIYVDGRRLSVSSDGTVDISGISNLTFKDVQKKIVVKARNSMSDFQAMGFTLEVGLDTQGSLSGNEYVMWLNRPTSLSSGSVLLSKYVMPDYTKLVSSDIAGSVFNDDNVNYLKDSAEKGYTGVTVTLKKKDGSAFFVGGNLVTSKDLVTSADGSYKFSELHSGDYVVMLKNLVRKADSDEVESIKGSTSVTASEGSLKLTNKSKFGTYEKLTQTVSYKNKYRIMSSIESEILLSAGSKLSDVNFGFALEERDLLLDQSPMRTRNLSGNQVELSWDVTIKNAGNRKLNDLVLHQQSSSSLSNIDATKSYVSQKVEGITGDIIAVAGESPVVFGYGSGVATTDGYWLVKPDGSSIKARGITGGIKFVTGIEPLSGSGGSGVATTDGYWLVRGDGSSIKVDGITGEIKLISGYRPFNSYSGSGVATTDGYWLVNPDGSSVKVSGITGEIKSFTGDWVLGEGGSGVATTDGYWLVKSDGSSVKVNGLTGEILSVTGEKPLSNGGSGVVTTDGYWLVKNDGSSIKVNGITGGFRLIAGIYPLSSYGGSGIVTTDGYWLVDCYGGSSKVRGITGEIKLITGCQYVGMEWGSGVATTDGYWLVKKDGSSKKVRGITGEIKLIDGERTLDSGGSGVATTDGYWLVEPDGSSVKVSGITGEIVIVEGDNPLLGSGSAVATTEGYFLVKRGQDIEETIPGGYWLVKSNGSVMKVSGIEGEIKGAIGAEPLSGIGGSAVWGDSGYWLVRYDGRSTKVSGITGEIRSVTGAKPLSSSGGSGVATTDGYWLVFPDGDSIKVRGITGEIKSVIGREPLGWDRGSGVATTDGYWLVSRDGGRGIKVRGITGGIKSVIGEMPLNFYGGSGVLTTDGYWLVKNDGSSIKVRGITGEIKSVIGGYPLNTGGGSGILTTDGYWLVKNDGSSIKVRGITGEIKSVIGRYPLNIDGGSGILTTDGYWLVEDNGWSRKVSGITGEVKLVEGVYPLGLTGSGVVTTDGYWLMGDVGNIVKASGIVGRIESTIGGYPLYAGGSGVLTTHGYWLVNINGESTKVGGRVKSAIGETPLTGGSAFWIDPIKIKKPNIIVTKAESKIVETVVEGENASPSKRDIKKGTMLENEYEIVELKVGETIKYTFTVRVKKKEMDMVYGSQSFITSAKTPRGGIPNTTGVGEVSGVPSALRLPSPANFKAEGLFGNPTIGINKDLFNDGLNENGTLKPNFKDDLADATGALVKGTGVVIPKGAISGYAWFDSNENGLRDDSQPVSGLVVTLRNKVTNGIVRAITNAAGFWRVEELDLEPYEVHYGIVGLKHNGKTWTNTVSHSNWQLNSDIDEGGYVTADVMPKEIDGSNPNGMLGKSDAGLMELKIGKICGNSFHTDMWLRRYAAKGTPIVRRYGEFVSDERIMVDAAVDGEARRVEMQATGGGLVVPVVVMTATGGADLSFSPDLVEGKLYEGKIDLSASNRRKVKASAGGKVTLRLKFKAYYDGGEMKEYEATIVVKDADVSWKNMNRSR